MKTCLKHLFLLPALITGLSLIPAGWGTAQTFTTLHGFTVSSGPALSTNSDGIYPYAGLILSGNTLYGTASGGGSSGSGTLFALHPDGTGFTNLHSFDALDTATFTTNTDGFDPQAGLLLSGNTLYGTAYQGGSSGAGTVFKVNTNGAGFTTLYSFTATDPNTGTNSDGANPAGGLILSGNTLYGTAAYGGNLGFGTVFKVNADGTGFTNLHSFTGFDDGANPLAGLILSGGTLYGTASITNGDEASGTVFKLNTDGSGFATLHSFAGGDGANPVGGLVLSGNTLYGTAAAGGSSSRGAVFAVNTNGTGFTNLHSFTALSGPPPHTNSDGANPYAGLILSGNTLYGTASVGGSSGSGTLFSINTNGAGFTTLYSFTENPVGINSDGANPQAGLILSGNTLYGTVVYGGSGKGTVFSLALPRPQLTIIRSGANVVLTWPTDAAGFTLQSAPAVTGTFTNLPAATSPYTNTITGSQYFFRLTSN